jgi:hypothetical protein
MSYSVSEGGGPVRTTPEPQRYPPTRQAGLGRGDAGVGWAGPNCCSIHEPLLFVQELG